MSDLNAYEYGDDEPAADLPRNEATSAPQGAQPTAALAALHLRPPGLVATPAFVENEPSVDGRLVGTRPPLEAAPASVAETQGPAATDIAAGARVVSIDADGAEHELDVGGPGAWERLHRGPGAAHPPPVPEPAGPQLAR